MTADPATLWTAEEVIELRRLHALTPVLSYTQIAAKIGRKRNACIGKAHRLELPDRSEMKNHGRPVKASTSVVKRRRGPVSPTRLVAAARQRIMAKRPGPRPVRLVLADGSDGCRWPTGDHPFVFCAAEVMKGQAYCGEHCRLAYKPRRAA